MTRPRPDARSAHAAARAVMAALAMVCSGGAFTAAHAAPLAVPLIRQSPERCGPAALQMVLRFYGADSLALAEAERAYIPALGGTLITDLAAAARRGGFSARVAALQDSDLAGLVARGIPPIVLYQNGRGPLTVRHYAVVVDWDAASATFTLHDGGGRPRRMKARELAGRWRAAGSQALIVTRPP